MGGRGREGGGKVVDLGDASLDSGYRSLIFLIGS